MPPQQPYNGNNQYPQYPQTPQPGGGQYDFIMSPGQPSKPNMFGNGKKLFVFAGIGAAVLIVVAILFSVFSGGNENSEAYLPIAQKQAELVRVADLGYSGLSSTQVKNFTVNLKATVGTDQVKLKKYLGENGIKFSEKTIEAGIDTETDELIKVAKETSGLDDALKKELVDELQSYQTSLQQAHKSSSNAKTKQVLGDMYRNAGLLIEQSEQ